MLDPLSDGRIQLNSLKINKASVEPGITETAPCDEKLKLTERRGRGRTEKNPAI